MGGGEVEQDLGVLVTLLAPEQDQPCVPTGLLLQPQRLDQGGVDSRLGLDLLGGLGVLQQRLLVLGGTLLVDGGLIRDHRVGQVGVLRPVEDGHEVLADVAARHRQQEMKVEILGNLREPFLVLRAEVQEVVQKILRVVESRCSRTGEGKGVLSQNVLLVVVAEWLL